MCQVPGASKMRFRNAYFRSLVHSSQKLWPKPDKGISAPRIQPCKTGGSQNLMNERYLIKTPFLTFDYLSKCNTKLPCTFGNSKRKFFWTGLLRSHFLSNSKVAGVWSQGYVEMMRLILHIYKNQRFSLKSCCHNLQKNPDGLISGWGVRQSWRRRWTCNNIRISDNWFEFEWYYLSAA